MFEKYKNPMKKFGMSRKDLREQYDLFRTIQLGETNDMFREMRRLNRFARKLGDRKYFVYPIGGLLDQSILVVGRKAAYKGCRTNMD